VHKTSELSGTYPLLAGDGAVPDHEVHRPVGHRLRLRDETLRISGSRSRPESYRREEGVGVEANREGARRYGHEGGSCAKPCAPPRGGRARSLLPTWAAAREAALTALCLSVWGFGFGDSQMRTSWFFLFLSSVIGKIVLSRSGNSDG
jgi:hypothetical protein